MTISPNTNAAATDRQKALFTRRNTMSGRMQYQYETSPRKVNPMPNKSRVISDDEYDAKRSLKQKT